MANKEEAPLSRNYCYISNSGYYVYMYMNQGKHYEFTGVQIRGRNQIRTLKDLDCGYFVVPKGFLSDGATIPTWVDDKLGWDPLRPEYLYAAVLHDWAYSVKWCKRAKCDWIFLKFIIFGSKRWKRWVFGPIMWISVRFWGSSYYR